MKKLKELPESDFLKLFFAFISLFFLVGAVCMPDRADMFAGLGRIVSSPSKLSLNTFAVGGAAGTFLNMGLVALASFALFQFCGAKPNNVSTLAFLLTLGFSGWGINIVNMWPGVLGVFLYCLVKKAAPGTMVNAMLFSTGLAPLFSDLMLRYPGAEVAGFQPLGILLAVAIGLAVGFFLPAGIAYAPKVHHGFVLYSAALPVGMTAFLLQGALYKTMGVDVPAMTTEAGSHPLAVNVFCLVLFGLCIAGAFLLGCKPKDYWEVLKDREMSVSVSGKFGTAAMLMNMGVYGLFILAYYNLIGATFSAVTLGVIFCMLCCGNSGSNPRTVLPLLIGYVGASFLFMGLSRLAGGNFAQAINAQAIVVGACFCNGLSPIVRKYGWQYGIAAGVLHYCIVTTVPNLHGGFCLYNGGLTSCLVCLIFVPVLENLCKTHEERLSAKA